jgi:plastocyanin
VTRLAAALAAVGLALLPGQAASATTTIAISNFSFQPATLTVPVGATVTWANRDATMHSVTSDTGAFDSGRGLCPPADCLSPGASFSHQFNAAGTLHYHCNIHTFMQATIVVGGSTATTASTSPPRPAPTTGPLAPPPTSAPRTTSPSTAVRAPSTFPTTSAPAVAAAPTTTSGTTGGASTAALPAATHHGSSSGGAIVALVALVAVLVAGLVVFRRWRSASALKPPA